MPLDGALQLEKWNWREPDYPAEFRRRAGNLQVLRDNPALLPGVRGYYRENPVQFICDWGCTFDPRNIERGLPALMPFIMFPKQVEFVEWILERWVNQEPGLAEKSRDVGASWTAMVLALTLCIFYEGMNIGFGSRKEEYVDKLGEPKSLFQKGREFLRLLPIEFRGGWTAKDHAPHMRLMIPDTNSLVSGEAGDNIGRGDRKALYFVDEAAHLERPQLVDMALSATTNCRIDMSSVNGTANPFYEKRIGGRISVFVFDWKDDPRKNQAWYEKQCRELDPIVVAQEIDRNYGAAIEGVIIPQEWVKAAVDAHIKLGFKPTGAKFGALDVADEGADLNAYCGAHGVVITYLDEWSGKGSDPYETAARAMHTTTALGFKMFRYDADGLGSSVRGDVKAMNARQPTHKVEAEAFRGSGEIVDPEGEDVQGRKNEDYFGNRKAQEWWRLRTRFFKTYQMVNKKATYSTDELISISSKIGPLAHKLVTELSQPTRRFNDAGKVIVNKKPEGSKSPNLADAVMMRFAAIARKRMEISDEAIAQTLPMRTRGLNRAPRGQMRIR